MTKLPDPRLDRYGQNFLCEPGLTVEEKPSQAALNLRLKYVEEMGWLEPGRTTDTDRYDAKDAGTIHISHGSADGEMIAAMRLTPTSDFEASLSFQEMIGNDESYQDAVRHQLAQHSSQQSGEVQAWDLTRLVHDTGRERSGQLLPAFLGMFGAGLAKTRPIGDSDKDIWWLFITTSKIRRTLAVCGIEVHDLGQSSAETAKETSYCCLVKPVEAMSRLKANPQRKSVYQIVKSGFDGVVGIE